MGETAQEVIGEPDAEGDGTVIGEFGSMETAVNDVRDAIGTEGSEGGNGSGGDGDDTLVGSIEYLGDKTEEEMGESGGDGIIDLRNSEMLLVKLMSMYIVYQMDLMRLMVRLLNVLLR